MAQLKHWTERSTADFLYRLGADFIRQLETAMEQSGDNQAAFAEKLGVSKGRVSQIINNPGNLTLRAMIDYARALDRKVAVVMYSDGDAPNLQGPINSEIFVTCWQRAGRPTNYFQLRGEDASTLVMHGYRSANDAVRASYYQPLTLEKTASNAMSKSKEIETGGSHG